MREFFTVRSVSEVLAGFRPERRTATEHVALIAAAGRVVAEPVVAAADLPGFARATVDGYAVRAADTFGASESLPAYLELRGEVTMGDEPDVDVAPGTAVSIPTGGMLPAGADAIVMVEHTSEPLAGTVEVVRPVAPGEGVVRRDEDAAAGAVLVAAGRALRAQDLAMLAAAGVVSVPVHRRPRVALLATGDEVVSPDTPGLRRGAVRDATTAGLAALVREAGGEPDARGIVPDDRDALRAALEEARGEADVVVVSAGSSVGTRDATAEVVAELGKPGLWCHGLAIKPGKPTLLAECDGVPVIGLPGNPLSALVVFRLVGMPVVRLVGGWLEAPPRATARAQIAQDVPSASGRLDVVQVRLQNGTAEPLFGKSALLSVLTQADGFVVVPEPAAGLYAGSEVEVELYS